MPQIQLFEGADSSKVMERVNDWLKNAKVVVVDTRMHTCVSPGRAGGYYHVTVMIVYKAL